MIAKVSKGEKRNVKKGREEKRRTQTQRNQKRIHIDKKDGRVKYKN